MLASAAMAGFIKLTHGVPSQDLSTSPAAQNLYLSNNHAADPKICQMLILMTAAAAAAAVAAAALVNPCRSSHFWSGKHHMQLPAAAAAHCISLLPDGGQMSPIPLAAAKDPYNTGINLA